VFFFATTVMFGRTHVNGA